jgi:transcriptional regulator with PAS, ATPase and Fis domain
VILAEDGGVISSKQLYFDFSGNRGEAVDRSATLPDKVRDLEKRMVTEALGKNSWNRKAAAADLGISYPTLLKKIRDYGLAE